MKVFLSWSGDLSHGVAMVLRDWIPSVLQMVEPYVSSEDIDKGARWSTDIAKELEASSYGILCVTSENLEAPWLNFEAGALSKAFDKANVSPFLFNVKRSEIKGGPILQFQSTLFSKKDIKKLVKGINKACDDQCLDDARIEKVFDVWWPQLEEQLNNIRPPDDAEEVAPIESKESASHSVEILEELLDLARTQQKLLRSPEDLLPARYLDLIIRKTDRGPRFHPEVFKDLDKRLNRFQAVLSEHSDEGADMSIEVVKDLFEDLLDPIQYIQRRAYKRPRGLLFDDEEI